MPVTETALTWSLRGGRGDAELPKGTAEPDVAENVCKGRSRYRPLSFARAVAYAISQPEDVTLNEILFGPTRQEL